MAEPANVPRKTFTGYLSLEKNIRNKLEKRDKKVALDFVGGGYSKGDMKCLEYQNESVRWIPQYILMGMKRKRKLNIEILISHI